MCVKFMNFKESCDGNADQNTVCTRLGTRRNINETQLNKQFGICDECVMRNCNAVDDVIDLIGCDEQLHIMKSNLLHFKI